MSIKSNTSLLGPAAMPHVEPRAIPNVLGKAHFFWVHLGNVPNNIISVIRESGITYETVSKMGDILGNGVVNMSTQFTNIAGHITNMATDYDNTSTGSPGNISTGSGDSYRSDNDVNPRVSDDVSRERAYQWLNNNPFIWNLTDNYFEEPTAALVSTTMDSWSNALRNTEIWANIIRDTRVRIDHQVDIVLPRLIVRYLEYINNPLAIAEGPFYVGSFIRDLEGILLNFNPVNNGMLVTLLQKLLSDFRHLTCPPEGGSAGYDLPRYLRLSKNPDDLRYFQRLLCSYLRVLMRIREVLRQIE